MDVFGGQKLGTSSKNFSKIVIFHFSLLTGETASNTAAEMKTRKAEMMEMDWMPIPAHTQKRMKVSTNATKAALMMKFLIVSIS